MTRGQSLSAAVALSAALAAACASQSELPATRARVPAPTLSTGTLLIEHRSVVRDDTVRSVLLRELNRDPVLGKERVGVESVGGVVTLEGTVSNRLAALRAVEIAHVVRGVRAIVDRISVAPTARPDSEMVFAVAAKLASDDAISPQRIGARSHEGTVRLSGDVDSGAARCIAVADVLAMPGVKAVVDDLSVSPAGTQERTDHTLDVEVARTLRADPWLDDARIAVQATNGFVKLTGWVGTAAELARADQDARTASPNGVDISALGVDAGTDSGTLRAASAAQLLDRDLAQAVGDAYMNDPRVQPFVPGIDVRDHVVVLTGIAPNAEAAAAVVADARNVPGVTGVQNDLQTEANLGEGDKIIRTDLESAINRDRELAFKHLTIEVADGRVTLRGTVDSEQNRLHAITLASTTPGVHAVFDRMTLEPRLPPANDQLPPVNDQGTGRAELQPAK